MKSVNRCKEQLQGDRCHGERGHESPVHESNNLRWSPTETTALHPVRPGTRRNRMINRTLRNIDHIAIKDKKSAREWLTWLTAVGAYFKGNK